MEVIQTGSLNEVKRHLPGEQLFYSVIFLPLGLNWAKPCTLQWVWQVTTTELTEYNVIIAVYPPLDDRVKEFSSGT